MTVILPQVKDVSEDESRVEAGRLMRLRRVLPPLLDSSMWALAVVSATALRLETQPVSVLTSRSLMSHTTSDRTSSSALPSIRSCVW